MARLTGLIKFHRWEIDQKRRVLGALQQDLLDIESALDRLDAEEAREMAHAGSEVALRHLGQYMKGVAEKRDALKRQKADKELEIDRQRDVVAAAFKELKSYEIADERARLRDQKARDKAEQDMLDERSQRSWQPD